MKFLFKDEDFPIDTFRSLESFGHDVMTLNDLDLNGIGFPDDFVLEQAKLLKRTVVTHNRGDFIKLHRDRTEPHYGIVICTRFDDDHELALAVHEAIKDIDLNDELIRVTRPNNP